MRYQRGRPPHEHYSVTGSNLLDKLKELIHQGNVRRLIVRRPNGKRLLEIPLTAGIGITGLLTLLTPMLVALGAITALVSQFRVEVEREPEPFEHRPYDDHDGPDR